MTTSPKPTELAKAVPLIEQMRSVPIDAVLKIDTPNPLGVDTRSIPIGRLCHEASALLDADDKAGGEASTDWERIARVQNAKLRAMCNEPGGFEKLREVMDRYEATRPQPQAAQPAERMALTDEKIAEIIGSPWIAPFAYEQYVAFARAIEAAHGITAKDQL